MPEPRKEFFRQRFDLDYDPAKYATDRGDPQQHADQSFKDECSTEFLLRQFGAMGNEQVARPDWASHFFEDVSGVPGDYLEAVNLVRGADEAFDALPAKIRNRFENDPAKLLSFLSDVGNRQEAISLGLVDAPPPVAPAGVDSAVPITPAGGDSPT